MARVVGLRDVMESFLVKGISASRVNLAAALVALMMVGPPSLAQAGTGVVNVTIGKAGFLVGLRGGRGVLTYQGRNYRLRISGISLGTIGVARAHLVGRAYNLRTPSDITGSYSAVTAGVAFGGGPKEARLRNSRGVVLELRGLQVGLDLTAALSGMSISLR